jgi:hypothetical protein
MSGESFDRIVRQAMAVHGIGDYRAAMRMVVEHGGEDVEAYALRRSQLADLETSLSDVIGELGALQRRAGG